MVHEPASAEERPIATLIQQHRTSRITELEQELCKQRKRLADAKRKLATKPTKGAAERQRIASDKSEKLVARLNELQDRGHVVATAESSRCSTRDCRERR